MKALFVVNPSSGKQNFHEKIEKLIGRLVMKQLVTAVDVSYTEKKDDARKAVCNIKSGDYDFITAIGGDGTLNEVINGVIESGSMTPVAVISAGTVNDFASVLHLPQDIDEFCDMIERFHVVPVDAGKVGEHYFINVVAAGLLTDVAYKVPKEAKAMFGKMAYYLEGAKDLPANMFKTIPFKFESEEYNNECDCLLFMVTNTKSVGGFKNMATEASVSDGLLDVIVIRKVEFMQVTNLLLKLLAGDHINHPSVDYFQTKHLKVSCMDDSEITVDYDGEYYGALPVSIEVVPKALNLLV
ncbi:MAG: diacylglycerol/lipid kinase family protein [Lachnospiraceae bacterium]